MIFAAKPVDLFVSNFVMIRDHKCQVPFELIPFIDDIEMCMMMNEIVDMFNKILRGVCLSLFLG